jgi:alpha-beta hydrolase superfamily lysophospholipase
MSPDMNGMPVPDRRRHLALAATLAMLASCQQAPTAQTPMPEQPSMMAVTSVNFMADDGLTVSGKYYRATKPKALILLFHQAGSSMDEYATIAPRLVEMGYSALAIDQRSGGTMFGKNLTAARVPVTVTYGDALHDLDAALDWSRSMNLPVIVWGSSYSAALVFELTAKHPMDISAVLAFSPGEYLGSGTPVALAASQVRVPVFVAVGSGPAELAEAKPIFDAIASSSKKLYLPKSGVHGSSTLIAQKNEAGAEANWAAVSKFLTAANVTRGKTTNIAS